MSGLHRCIYDACCDSLAMMNDNADFDCTDHDDTDFDHTDIESMSGTALLTRLTMLLTKMMICY